VRRASAASVFFGDTRLDDRLFDTFNQMARRPAGTLPQKLVKRAELVGGYRMLNNPKVTHRAILDAHRASCLERLAGHQGKVLLIHDTTVLDYSGLDVDGGGGGGGGGLGQVGDGHGKGLYAHNSLAVIPATRQVVGLVNQVLHKRARVPRAKAKRNAWHARTARAGCGSGRWRTCRPCRRASR
jgi:transposase-like protein